MLETIFTYIQVFAILGIAAFLIMIFGAIVAIAVYIFVLMHVRAYEICKEVLNGIISANA